MNPAKSALLWASENDALKERVPTLPLARKAVRRFMPGEDIDSALDASQQLADAGMPTIITRLGEHVTKIDSTVDTTRHYCDAVDRISSRGLKTEVSIKLTQLGLDLDAERTYENLDTLIRHAAEHQNWIWIDMEETPYVDRTLEIYRRARENHENVGVCLQSYLYRTADDLMDLLPLAPAIRLVKGAYMEPAHLAFPKKRDVDTNFLTLAELMLEHVDNGLRATFGTHDLEIVDRVRQRAASIGIAADRYEIQMLYGIRTRDQRRLAAEDGIVRVLISYGPDWYPWYMRRLAERPANVLFVLKNLL